jgi:hypothetical protein
MAAKTRLRSATLPRHREFGAVVGRAVRLRTAPPVLPCTSRSTAGARGASSPAALQQNSRERLVVRNQLLGNLASVRPNPSLNPDPLRQATLARPQVHGTLSASGPRRPASAVRLARTLGLSRVPPRGFTAFRGHWPRRPGSVQRPSSVRPAGRKCLARLSACEQPHLSCSALRAPRPARAERAASRHPSKVTKRGSWSGTNRSPALAA